jgi:hypothetical protein
MVMVAGTPPGVATSNAYNTIHRDSLNVAMSPLPRSSVQIPAQRSRLILVKPNLPLPLVEVVELSSTRLPGRQNHRLHPAGWHIFYNLKRKRRTSIIINHAIFSLPSYPGWAYA